MKDILVILKDTPFPSILAIGGIALLILSFLQKASGDLEPTANKGLMRIFGVGLLLSSIAISVISSQPVPQDMQSAAQLKVTSTVSRVSTVIALPEKPKPESTAPANQSQVADPQNDLRCKFMNELLSKSQVEQVLQGSSGVAGVQARLTQDVVVPVGWTVHNQGVPYEGPVKFKAGTFASFWGPSMCQPFDIPTKK